MPLAGLSSRTFVAEKMAESLSIHLFMSFVAFDPIFGPHPDTWNTDKVHSTPFAPLTKEILSILPGGPESEKRFPGLCDWYSVLWRIWSNCRRTRELAGE